MADYYNSDEPGYDKPTLFVILHLVLIVTLFGMGFIVETFTNCGITLPFLLFIVGLYALFLFGTYEAFCEKNDEEKPEEPTYQVLLNDPVTKDGMAEVINAAGEDIGAKLNVLIESQNLNGQMLKYLVDYVNGQSQQQAA